MTDEWNPDGIFDVLASEESRRILAAASVRPMTAKELEQLCSASLPTIYRRLNVLVDYDLLSEEQLVDPAQEQSTQYSTDLQELSVTVEDGSFDVNIAFNKDRIDKFGELMRDLGEGHRGSVTESGPFPGETPTEE